MLVVADKEHDYQGEELNMALLGVVDVPKSVEKYGVDHTFDFLMNKHPVKTGKSSHLRPLWVRKVREENGNTNAFAIFVATKEANPESSRHLPKNADLVAFRDENNVVEFNEQWENWEQILNEFA